MITASPYTEEQLEIFKSLSLAVNLRQKEQQVLNAISFRDKLSFVKIDPDLAKGYITHVNTWFRLLDIKLEIMEKKKLPAVTNGYALAYSANGDYAMVAYAVIRYKGARKDRYITINNLKTILNSDGKA